MAGKNFGRISKNLGNFFKDFNFNEQELKEAKEAAAAVKAAPKASSYTLVSSKIDAPKMMEGVTLQDYKFGVQCWEAAVEDSIPPEKRAMLLINQMPSNDNRCVKKLVVDRVTPEVLRSERGVEELLKALETAFGLPPFIKLWQWQENSG